MNLAFFGGDQTCEYLTWANIYRAGETATAAPGLSWSNNLAMNVIFIHKRDIEPDQ